MPCLKPDGTLSAIGIQILEAVQESAQEDEIALASGLALFRARSAVRGLVKAGLVERAGDAYVATPEGREKLAAQER